MARHYVPWSPLSDPADEEEFAICGVMTSNKHQRARAIASTTCDKCLDQLEREQRHILKLIAEARSRITSSDEGSS